MNKLIISGAAVAMALAAGSAQAALFSFASDNSDHSWVYTGNAGNVNNATPADPLHLLIDDDNGAAPPLEVSVSFSAQYTLTFVGNVTLPGGAQAMTYAANGSFTFTDVASGVTLLTTNFSNALFSTRANANMTNWTTTASLQVDDGNGATVSMVWGGANLPQYGLAPGSLNGLPRGFAFDLTAINTSGQAPWNGSNAGVALNPNTRLPSQQWFSESSFSATARVIPAPGALALLGLGGLVAGRRRR